MEYPQRDPWLWKALFLIASGKASPNGAQECRIERTPQSLMEWLRPGQLNVFLQGNFVNDPCPEGFIRPYPTGSNRNSLEGGSLNR